MSISLLLRAKCLTSIRYISFRNYRPLEALPELLLD